MKTHTNTRHKHHFYSKTLLLIPVFLPFFIFSQGGSASKVKSNDWNELYEQANYTIEYRYNICDLKEDGIVKEEVYLRVNNLTGDTLHVSWDLELVYGERCYNCSGENDELKINLVLPPNESISGSCGDDNKYHLRLFSRFLHGEADSKLSDFNLRNLRINTL
ncbi:MAG: hypothetical protein K0R65_981 [Crocinitomicaceae bacterium]|jgi:hypothetical protein|nr:hypothetical protein [Crocinitomicaceae bacterium]